MKRVWFHLNGQSKGLKGRSSVIKSITYISQFDRSKLNRRVVKTVVPENKKPDRVDKIDIKKVFLPKSKKTKYFDECLCTYTRLSIMSFHLSFSINQP